MSLLRAKIYALAPYWGFKNMRVRGVVKKANKDIDKYPVTFQWKFLVKRAKRVMRALNADVEVIGYDNLPKGSALLLPNHQSNLDVIALVYALKKQSHEQGVQHKRARFIAKKELKYKKSLKGWFGITNTVFFDRKNPRDALKVFGEFGKSIKKSGDFGVIFPEGTRTKDGNIQTFKSGAIRLAKQEFLPIIPVTINGTKQLENLDRKGKLKIQVIFNAPVKPMTIMSQPNEHAAKRIQNIVEREYIPFKPATLKKEKFS